MLNRRRIIYLLIFLIAFLLSLNVFLKLIKKKEVKQSAESEMTISALESVFLKTLGDFAIQEKWIKRKRYKSGADDSVKYKFSISLPIEVTAPEVIKDLNINLNESPVKIIADEKRINDYTSLTISSNGKQKLIAEFNYDNSLKRSFSEIAFLLKNMELASEPEIDKFRYLTYPFGSILPLEEDSQEKAEYLKQITGNYFVEISEETDKVEFELDQDLGLDELTRNIRNIISSFNSPKVFFIDGSKNEFKPEIVNFLNDEFAKRGRKLVNLENYSTLKGESEEDLRSLFKFHVNNIEYGSSKIFIISYVDWLNIFDEIKNYTKLGNKIVSPVKLL